MTDGSSRSSERTLVVVAMVEGITTLGEKRIIVGQIKELKRTGLTSEEETLLEKELSELARVYKLEQDMSRLLLEDLDVIKLGAQIAKGVMDEKPFGGVYATEGQFGFRLIIPQSIIFKDKTYLTTWKKTYTSTGWQNLFGTSTNPIKMPTQEGYRRVLVITKLVNHHPVPKLDGIKIHMGRTEYNTYFINQYAKFSELKVAELPGYILFYPGVEGYIRGHVDEGIATPANDEPALFGVEFAEAEILRSESVLVPS